MGVGGPVGVERFWRQKSSLILNSRGLGLIEILIVISVISVATFGTSQLMLQLRQQSRQSVALVHIDVVKRNFVTLIVNNASWAKTLQEGSLGGAASQGGMDCLKNSTPCTADGSVGGQPLENIPFAVYDAANQLYYNALNQSSGLTTFGMPCDTYPSPSCPLRFNIIWSANCVPGNCVNPQVKVQVNLAFSSNGGSPLVINPGNYSVPQLFRAAQ